MTRPLRTAALVLALAAPALLVTAPPAAAKKPACWKALIDDWYDGRIDKAYPAHCYREAIKNAPADVQDYSSLRDDLSRALAAAIHKNGGGKGGSKGAVKSKDALVGPGSRGRHSGVKTRQFTAIPTAKNGGGGGDKSGFFRTALDKFSPSNADALPLPLIVLAGLALLLLAAGGAGMVTRRVQARRAGPPGTPPFEP